MQALQKEAKTFHTLSYEDKLAKVEKWIGELTYHYDFFRDLEVYIKTHREELNEQFVDATFQIILNLAKALQKA